MKKKCRCLKTTGIVLGVILLFTAGYMSAKYDMDKHGNWVTILSGFWSAGATVFLGIVAVWQNFRYKELSDKSNKRLEDIIMKPECYLEFLHKGIGHMYGENNKFTPKNCDSGIDLCFTFLGMNLPIFKFGLDYIFVLDKNGEKKESHEYEHNERIGYFDQGNGVSINVIIPEKNLVDGTKCDAYFSFYNMHDMRYEKRVTFKVVSDNQKALSFVMISCQAAERNSERINMM